MTISILDYISKATVSLDRSRSQRVSITMSLREQPILRSEEILRWPDVYVASHLPAVYQDSFLLTMQLLNVIGISDDGDSGPLEETLGDIYSEIRIACAQCDLARTIGINIWDYSENVCGDIVTVSSMRAVAFQASIRVLLGIDIFALRYGKNRDERSDDFSLHELKIWKMEKIEQQLPILVDLKELVRAEKESRKMN